ncbi:hypothetical protein CDAR_32961 [Caerostris darwini]|uniref:Uncharacterized protein n=1 Tax=Caerostris darwini TaxID=1538125 RepID=A0AAV4SNT4_9ARAC|nr:hypothetical protein CDAR_32961 [Caerostris darwini]
MGIGRAFCRSPPYACIYDLQVSFADESSGLHIGLDSLPGTEELHSDIPYSSVAPLVSVETCLEIHCDKELFHKSSQKIR